MLPERETLMSQQPQCVPCFVDVCAFGFLSLVVEGMFTFVLEHIMSIIRDTSKDGIGIFGVSFVNSLGLEIKPVEMKDRVRSAVGPLTQNVFKDGLNYRFCLKNGGNFYSPPEILSTEKKHFALPSLQRSLHLLHTWGQTKLLNTAGTKHTALCVHPEPASC